MRLRVVAIVCLARFLLAASDALVNKTVKWVERETAELNAETARRKALRAAAGKRR
jgi:hypothetical protein